MVADFVVEAREHLGTIEQRLLRLERDPTDAGALHSAFRGFHTIKGLAGFLEFTAVQEVAHQVEAALNLAREGELLVTPEFIDVALECVDYLNRAVSEAEVSGGAAQSVPDARLLDRVRAAMRRGPAAAPMAHPCYETLPASGSVGVELSAGAFSVRVDTGKLDYLADMAGQLAAALSLVRQNPALAAVRDPELRNGLSQLGRLTAEVQKTACSMRMVPIGQLFQRTARFLRCLSRRAGKRVGLDTRGGETKVDKTIAESLADPLMHMMRNAIDHGIEDPAERQAAGKPPSARVVLAAYRRGGEVVIEVADDGRGLDYREILARARQRGLVGPSAQVSESDVFRLILEPGLSTAEQVTEISGRGVGMDVVRRQVEKLGGRIEILSEAGRGTTFLLRLPLTPATLAG